MEFEILSGKPAEERGEAGPGNWRGKKPSWVAGRVRGEGKDLGNRELGRKRENWNLGSFCLKAPAS